MGLEFLGSAFISSAVGVVCDRLVSWAASTIISSASPGRKRKHEDDERVVVVMLEKLKFKLLAVKPLLNDAEVKQWTQPAIKEWMDEIKHVLYLADDLQEEFATKAMQSKLISEFPTTTTTKLTTTHQDVTEGISIIESRIEVIIKRLEDFVNIAKDSLGLRQFDVVGGRNNPPSHRLPQTSSLVNHDSVYGRDNDKEKIIKLLISEDDSNGHRVSVIPIVGMGGIGKTTLAQLAYNDPKVVHHFEIKSWVCVSEEFDILRVTKTILEELKLPHFSDKLNTLQVELRNGLSGKKFLIVLDDVWNENYNNWLKLSLPFGLGKHGSKIIVTTRQNEVASIMLHDPIAPNPIIHLRELSDEYCWQVFSKHAFGNASLILPPDIKRIGKKIVEKCKGLPLAATTLGGMFHKLEVKEWERVLESQFWDFLPNANCDILPALMLSYHHLPSHLKLCFAFCAIIPKDHIFKKDQLVPLWIALGFVEQPTDNRTIEDIGDGYFRELISRSLFQQSRYDGGFLMHDLINDLAQFVAGKYCHRSDYGHPPDFSKVRYFSYSRDYRFDTLKITNEANNLRTIYCFTWNMFDLRCRYEKVLHDMLATLRCLRVLSLQGFIIYELPDSIGNLIHLRYLVLSHSSIKYLPETICRLCNLETLLLKWCGELTRLPTDLWKLIHLRHLDITRTKLREMPMQIGRLTSLQCLTNFMVGNQNGSAAIRELRELRDLRGTLSISNLQNVLNESDALEANLNNKKHLEELNLEWGAMHTRDSQKEMKVLENLQPHINLKDLTIEHYGGTRFPDWLGDRSFVNLKSLCLRDCSYCCEMPPLGQLPCLQNLTIEGMNSIVKVGSEFYGYDSAGRKPFQSLEILTFQKMPEWETWSILEAGEFCKLLELVVSDCPKLSFEFPKHLPYLKKLEIDGCQRLLTLDGLQNATSLQSLDIKDCPNMVSIGEGGLPANLTEIYIYSCEKLKALPDRMCTLLPSLQTLHLANLPEIEYSFLSGGLPSSLFSLTISHCDKLMARRMDWGLQRLPSLQICRLVGECEQGKFLESFPEECLLPTSLTTLQISDRSNMKSLNPNALRHLNSLAILRICDCPNLLSLPDEGLPSSLSSLQTWRCPLLQVRYQKGKGEDWLKISHIPNIRIR